MNLTPKVSIAIIGGGPAALFMVKGLVELDNNNFCVTIFEKADEIGSGMPYSKYGANKEHVANVSEKELPQLFTSVSEWLGDKDEDFLKAFNINLENFHEHKVLPRLLLGEYLSAQFSILLQKAKEKDVEVNVSCNTEVEDIVYDVAINKTIVFTNTNKADQFDYAIICTGHKWPYNNEKFHPGWFDSPYPPSKLQLTANYPVAIKGSSLTAIDAIRTLALQNGIFRKDENGQLFFERKSECPNFKIVLHSLKGLLPSIRFYLEDPEVNADITLSDEETIAIKHKNDGFIPLDYIFIRNFKEPLRKRNVDFYEKIKDMSLEEFTDYIMSFRENIDPILLFKGEYNEAYKSIKRQQSIDWKEEFSILSYAINFPAKHMCAEDMLRLQKHLMPLIGIIIAMVPQQSAETLIALYDAGALEIVSVNENSTVEPHEKKGCLYRYTSETGEEVEAHYNMFIDATGQPQFPYKDFLFKGLMKNGTVSPAQMQFRSASHAQELMANNDAIEKDSVGNYWLTLPGISINDHFQVLDKFGAANNSIFIMAVPYISGLNPDFSGLDFCERASKKIAEAIEYSLSA